MIYDWNKWYVCKNWFFTSVTRATDFKRIKFFRYAEDEDSKSKRVVEQYFKNKISSYLEQDAKAGRDVSNGNYVDEDFLMDLMNTQCQNCNEPLTIDFDEGRIVSNITCQRVNNEQSHFKDNCIGFCNQCNCAFSNKISL